MRVRRFILILACCAPVAAHPGHDSPEAATLPAPETQRQTIAYWQARLTADPADTTALRNLPAALLSLARRTTDHADLRAAEAAYRQLMAFEEPGPGTHAGLAQALSGQHRFDEALAEARAAAASNPENKHLLALLGDIHLARGDIAEAGAIFRRLADQELTLDSLSRIALLEQALGHHDEAAKAMTEAIEAGRILEAPPAALAWCISMLGEFALDRSRLDEASARFNEALTLDPGLNHCRWRFAQIDLRRNDIAKALPALQSLAEQSPKSSFLITLGDAYAKSPEPGAAKAAQDLFTRARQIMQTEIDQGDPGHAREFAEFLLSHDGDVKKAVELAALDLRSRQDAGAFDLMAWSLYRSADNATDRAATLKSAATHAAEAASRAPGDARILSRAGIVLAAAGRRPEAAQFLYRAARINPALEEPLATEARRTMETMAPPPTPTEADTEATHP